MNHSTPTGKTVCELEGELATVYRDYPEYRAQMTFGKMAERFAADPFYKLHLVAKEYLSVDPVFRVVVLA
jgi:hypothetical protein